MNGPRMLRRFDGEAGFVVWEQTRRARIRRRGRGGGRRVVSGVDLEEMVEDYEEHGEGAEEDGERVQGRVGYHVLFSLGAKERRGGNQVVGGWVLKRTFLGSSWYAEGRVGRWLKGEEEMAGAFGEGREGSGWTLIQSYYVPRIWLTTRHENKPPLL